MKMTNGSSRFRPRLDALEERWVPDAAQYIQGMYDDVLGRPADQAEVNAWRQTIDSGVSPATIATGFWYSSEHRGAQVDDFILNTFNRAAGEAERQALVDQLISGGASQLDIQKQLLLSPEYQAANATDEAFIEALYRDLLGRPSDSEGVVAWIDFIQGGNSRAGMIDRFLLSDEYTSITVQGFYTDLLGRGSDPAGSANWTELLQGGMSPESVAVRFLASDEYLTGNGFPVTPPVTPQGSTPSLGVAGVTATDSATGSIVNFLVTLSAPSDKTVSVDYSTSDVTAIAGLDYVFASGTVIIPPGETTASIPIQILSELSTQESTETFTLTLTNALNATIGNATATGTIVQPAAVP